MYLTLQRNLPTTTFGHSFCCLLVALLQSGGVQAHHGTGASYDRENPVEMSGVVREFVFRNPHGHVFIDVTDSEGVTVTWGAEMTSILRLSRLGWTQATLQPGDEISLTVFPSRTGGNAVEVDRAAPLIVNGEPVARELLPWTQPVPAQSTRDLPYEARDLTGVWRTLGGHQRSVAGESSLPMTALGEARYAEQRPSYGPRGGPPALGNDPTGDCNPLGVTRSLLYDAPFEIVQLPDRVVQLFQWTRFWRDIWMNGRSPPEDLSPRWLGYSVGRWEEETFVIETTHFDDRTWLDQLGHPHSDAMRLIERWQRVDHDTLVLHMTIFDSEIYVEPIEVDTKTYVVVSDPEFREDICAPVDEDAFNQRIRNPAGGLAPAG